MPTSQASIYNSTPFSNRQNAIDYLCTYTEWSIGKFFTVFYRKPGTPGESTPTNVRALIAVGIKNASECGPIGQYSADVWENKYYPVSTCGAEFFTIVHDTDNDIDPTNNDPLIELNNTTITLNGFTHTVANQNIDGDDEILDPFNFKEIPLS